MLMNWSSSYPYEETQNIELKRKTRPKITNPKQLEEDELADFNPPPHPEIKKVESYPIPEPPVSDPAPIYDKPFEHIESYKNTDSVLLEKLNYMIYLLEEQRDEKTGQVTEELILYIFLGIFVLFVLDSCVRTGKYSR